jgi:hypothetical protein
MLVIRPEDTSVPDAILHEREGKLFAEGFLRRKTDGERESS